MNDRIENEWLRKQILRRIEFQSGGGRGLNGGLNLLCRQCGIHAPAISPFLKGKRSSITFWVAARLATALDIDLSQLQKELKNP